MVSQPARFRRYLFVSLLAVGLLPLSSIALAAETTDTAEPTLEDKIDPQEVAPLVFGGNDIGNPGWVASIIADGFYSCTGSLVHPQWVLTAAHCVDDPGATYQVMVGSSLWYSGHERTVASRHIHPGYNSANPESVDLALVRLSSAIQGTPLPVLAASATWPVIGQTLVVTGWGQTSTGSPPPDQLQGAGVYVRSDSTGPISPTDPFCPDGWVGSAYDDFCFSSAGSWACRGDSGGPLIGRSSPSATGGEVRTIYGITSYGDVRGCSQVIFDSVAQSIGPHIGWIRGLVPQPPVARAGDEMFFYREDGLFRFYDVRDNGSLGSPILAGDGYTTGWDSITGIDLDGDGQDEMFFYREDGLFRFYDVRSNGSLGSPILAGNGYTRGWDAITAIDLDGDGQDEMFFYREDGLFRYYNVGSNGAIGQPILAGNGYTRGWDTITAIDLEGDGQDEVFFYREDGLYRFYNISANGAVGQPILAGDGYTTGWSSITAIDLQGDGRDEMFFYRTDGLFRFYAVRPDGRLGSPIVAGDGYTTGWSSITAVNLG